MKKILVAFIALAFSLSAASAADKAGFDKHFTSGRLRLDLQFAGNYENLYVFLETLCKESNWAGPRENILDNLDRGDHYMKVFATDGTLIYSRGFNTLFREWRTTAEAKKVSKTSTLSLWMPFPKEKVRVVIYDKPKDSGKLTEMLAFEVDPADKLIVDTPDTSNKVVKLLDNGNHENKVDMVFLAEGYTAGQMDKFMGDARRFMDYMFEMEPYKDRKADFNIWAVESVSREDGTDIPQNGIWKDTAFGSHFHTFYEDRYLTLPDQKLICQAVSGVPCDALFVIVNTQKYGGGGMYNFYGIASADDSQALPVFIHEFGHSFAGLGDEYYTSSTAYDGFYNLEVEPWEPNITTLVDFPSKWKSMIAPGTPVPTPNDPSYGSRAVGLFEGGGYMSKGIYRPAFDCRMKTNAAESFCPVCQKAIGEMIDYLIGKGR